jgi:hypothetical protein
MRTVPWPPGGTWALDVMWARLEIGAAMKRLLKASVWDVGKGLTIDSVLLRTWRGYVMSVLWWILLRRTFGL